MRIKRRLKLLLCSCTLMLFFASCLTSVLVATAFAGRRNSDPAQAESISPQSLFKENDKLVITGNVDSPDYIKNGYIGYQAYYDGSGEKNKELYVTCLSSHENGVKIDVNAPDTKIEFKNEFQIDNLTPTTPIFDFAVIPSKRGAPDFSSATIRICDAEDENCYIDISVKDLGNSGGGYSRVQTFVGTNKIIDRGIWNGDMATSSGTGGLSAEITGSFCGVIGHNKYIEPGAADPYEHIGVDQRNIWVNPFSFRFDTQTGWIYSEDLVARKRYYILNVYNGIDVGVGDEFTGFTSGKVKVSLTLGGFTGSSATVLVYNVFGVQLSGETITDKSKPELFVNLPEADKIPYAEINKKYPVFDCETIDAICGKCDYVVSLKAPNAQEFVVLSDDYFIPTLPGDYTLRYSSTDAFGNENSIDYVVSAKYNYDKLTFDIDDTLASEYNIGDAIYIPTYKVSGGMGATKSFVEVFRVSDGSRQTINAGNSFIPKLAGEYNIIFTAVDYIGNKAEEAIRINVHSTNQPSFGGATLNIPDKLISGARVELPLITAYDYYKMPGVGLEAKYELKVSGNGKEQVIGKDRLFTPTIAEFGNSVKISYYFYCEGFYDQGVLIEKTATIVEAKQVGDYFSYNSEEFSIGYNLPQNANDRFVEFTAKKSETSTFSFVNRFIEDNTKIDLEVKAGKQSFDGLKLTFTDSENSAISVDFVIKKYNDKNSMVQYNGLEYKMNGGFNNEETDVAAMQMSIRLENGTFYDRTNTKIFTISHLSDGSVFTGFPSGYVKVSFTLLNPIVDKAALTIKALNNYAIYATYDEEGEMVNFEDIFDPMIFYSFDYSIDYKLNDTMKIPYAKAVDTFASYVDVKVSLQKPDGEYLYKNVAVSNDLSVIFDQVGWYILSYSSTDNNKNTFTAEVYIEINEDKEVPTISLESTNTWSYVKDETIILPKYYALDDCSTDLEIYMFVLLPSGIFEQVDATSREYKPTSYGKHVVYYCVVDEVGNMSFETFNFVCNK